MSLLDHPVFVPTGDSAASLRRALALTVTLALVALAVLLPVMQNSDETTQGYRIRALEQQQSDLEAQIYNAQADIAQLGSLSRIDSQARGRLGMVPTNRGLAVSVSVPRPEVRPLPNGYLPERNPAAPPMHESLWKRLITLISFI